MTEASSFSVDGVTSLPSVFRTVMATFCSGASYRCMTLTPHCSSIVFGQTVQSYDGTLVVHDGLASLKGFGTVPACSGNADYNLGL